MRHSIVGERWRCSGQYDVAALTLIAAAVVLRLVMLHLTWPALNSDEGTIGLMARHIVYGGEHPVYFYGQSYMGALEAYLAAGFFMVLGPTDIALRLGLIVLFALFLACMYLLACTLYSRIVGLVSLAILSLGSEEILLRELTAIGGYVETLFFGSLLMLLAGRLVMSAEQEPATPRIRLGAYAACGLAAGLGFWSDMLVLPFIAAAGALLFAGCRNDLLGRNSIAAIAIGTVVGLSPILAYDVRHSPEQSAIATLYGTFRGSAHSPLDKPVTLGQQVAGTFLMGLPLATGASAVCSTSAQASWPLTPHSSSHTLLCTALHGLWSGVIVGLWSASVLAALLALRPLWKRRGSWSRDDRARARLHLARVALLSAAGLTVFLYMLSPSAALQPRVTYRYILGVSIALPALLATLIEGKRWGGAWRPRITRASGIAAIVILLCVLLIGTRTVLGPVSDYTRWKTERQLALIGDLHRLGVSHIYSDYWTCDRLAFQSQESVTCAVLGDDLRPGQDRYLPYRAIVRADREASYVFPVPSPQASALQRRIGTARTRYGRSEIGGYVVYRPVSVKARR